MSPDDEDDFPRLRWDQPASILMAVCPTGVHVLRTGLGALGVGTMWGTAYEGDATAGLPVQSCHEGFGVGDCCCCKPPRILHS